MLDWAVLDSSGQFWWHALSLLTDSVDIVLVLLQNFLKCSLRVFNLGLMNQVWDLLMAEAHQQQVGCLLLLKTLTLLIDLHLL